jgi:hypothetical protein
MLKQNPDFCSAQPSKLQPHLNIQLIHGTEPVRVIFRPHHLGFSVEIPIQRGQRFVSVGEKTPEYRESLGSAAVCFHY